MTTTLAARSEERAVLWVLSGLLLGLFVSVLSTTIVSSALPTIIGELRTSQAVLTWIVVAEVLAMTVSVPVWGSCADIYNKKRLIQIALLLFLVGSLLAALSGTWEQLIAGRVLQGVGAGGLTSLAQIVLATLVSARELGRYQGYFGAIFMVAAVAGPLLGGIIVSASWLGWRWCFWSAVPATLVAMVVVQRTLTSEDDAPQSGRVDWAGAGALTSAVSVALIWVTFAGTRFAWISWSTAMFAAGLLALLVGFVAIEQRAKSPVLPLALMRNRTLRLVTIACIPAGMAMFGSAVFLSQYLQEARGLSPVMAGAATLPLTISLLGASTISGRLITRWGRWKPFLVVGAILMPAGATGLATLTIDSSHLILFAAMSVFGAGIGLLMQNLILVAQNEAEPQHLGVTTSFVSFFRALGGAVGMSALGAVIAIRLTNDAPSKGGSTETGSGMPEALASATALVFLILAIASLITLVIVFFLRESPLRTETGAERLSVERAAAR